MPHGVPIQWMFQPRDSSAFAMASPGKMWPPDPAVMMRIVLFTSLVFRPSPSEVAPALVVAVLRIEPQQDRERHRGDDDSAPAEGQQRQREALGRNEPHVHAHVDEGLP